MPQQKIDNYFKKEGDSGRSSATVASQSKQKGKRDRDSVNDTAKTKNSSGFESLFSPCRKKIRNENKKVVKDFDAGCVKKLFSENNQQATVNPPSKESKDDQKPKKPSTVDEQKNTDTTTEKQQTENKQQQESAAGGQEESIKYSRLVEMFEKVESESKRLVITDLCVKMLKSVINDHPEDLLPTIYLCVNRVAPEHEGIELGIGDATLIKVLADSTGKKASEVKKELQQTGDLGIIASKARTSQRTLMNTKIKELTIREVFETFLKIAKEEGGRSQEQKRRHISRLLVSAKGNEAGYIIRSLQGKLRIGLAEQTILTSLATAIAQTHKNENGFAVPPEDAVKIVKQVYSECPSYDVVIPSLLEGGVQGLDKRCGFVAGVPVKPMLAKPTNEISEVLDKFSGNEFTCEFKYDGERAQIHVLCDGSVRIFSRNSENMTGKYPDIVERIGTLLKEGVRNAVFDCEAVAYDPDNKQIMPFQILSTRSRKDVKMDDIKVQVCVFAFDCLYLNDKVLLGEPLTVRREALYSALKETEGQLKFAVAKTSTDVEQLQQFLDAAIEEGTEGLIVKTMDGTYEPSKRSLNWLKLKKDYMEGVGDSIDVVVIGAWHGRGKRVGGYGSFLLAIYDSESERYQSISKIGTGFSEELLKQLSEKLKQDIVDSKRSYYDVGEGSQPDVWFGGKHVWEIKAADLSISPLYRAAAGWVDDTKGVSVRFPRLVREREDKTPEESTSPEQISEMYKKQIIVQKSSKKGNQGDNDDDGDEI